jgi:hypothetical protein
MSSVPPLVSVANSAERLMDAARSQITDLVIATLPTAFPEVADPESLRAEIQSKMTKIPSSVKGGSGDLALPCFVFAKAIKASEK